MRIHTFTYPVRKGGLSIRDFLFAEGYSRSVFTAMKQCDFAVLKNGRKAFLRERTEEGDLLEISVPEETSKASIVPRKLPFQIVYEDEHILVVNKPCNMPVHPSLGNYENTLANAVMYHWKEKEEESVFRAINRLDRDTTGLLVIARHMLAGVLLYKAMQERRIGRTYIALVHGKTDVQGCIDLPIARAEDSLIARCIDFEKGERAVTHFERLAVLQMEHEICSLLKLNLETGRTHQIRVHMAHTGHPLVGESLYADLPSCMQRQALHAWKLAFIHPVTKEEMCFTAPLPADFPPACRHALE